MTQEEKFSEVLKSLNKQITKDDRREASEQLKIAYHTLVRYLGGSVPNLDTAIKIIDFLHERIKNREKKLQEYEALKPIIA